jgi:mannose-6-phosphate isomerase-like protein (cupin superfamily)
VTALDRTSTPSAPAIARADEAETLQLGRSTMQLLLDASATGGAVRAHRVWLPEGELGANPHRHTRSSELFYVLDGTVDILAGDRVLRATAGDFVAVPPGHAHAFAASPGCRADLLVMITPAIDRFDFFRALSGAMDPDVEPGDRSRVLKSQPDYDTYPIDSTEWSTR